MPVGYSSLIKDITIKRISDLPNKDRYPRHLLVMIYTYNVITIQNVILITSKTIGVNHAVTLSLSVKLVPI